MNTVDIEKFIECVKSYPILYNRRHKFYNNFARKQRTWELIAEEMNESSEVLRIKWKGLKDGYTKFKRFRAGVAPSNRSYHSWCWSENLKFLDDFAINKKYCKYKQALETINSSLSQPSPVEDNDSHDNLESGQWSVTAPLEYQSDRRKLSVTDEEMEPKRQNLDPIDHLFSSYAGTFRNFSLKTQCLIKLRMAKVFADAELAEFNNAPSEEVSAQTAGDKDVDSISRIKIERVDHIEKHTL